MSGGVRGFVFAVAALVAPAMAPAMLAEDVAC